MDAPAIASVGTNLMDTWSVGDDTVKVTLETRDGEKQNLVCAGLKDGETVHEVCVSLRSDPQFLTQQSHRMNDSLDDWSLTSEYAPMTRDGEGLAAHASDADAPNAFFHCLPKSPDIAPKRGVPKSFQCPDGYKPHPKVTWRAQTDKDGAVTINISTPVKTANPPSAENQTATADPSAAPASEKRHAVTLTVAADRSGGKLRVLEPNPNGGPDLDRSYLFKTTPPKPVD